MAVRTSGYGRSNVIWVPVLLQPTRMSVANARKAQKNVRLTANNPNLGILFIRLS